MFFEGDRIDAMREMILADNVDGPQSGAGEAAAVSARRFRRHLQGAQGLSRRRSVSSIRRCTNSCRTTTRQQADLAQKLGITVEKITQRVKELHEFNPMLGHRGCRLGIVYPEITEMQARAVFEAAAKCRRKASR